MEKIETWVRVQVKARHHWRQDAGASSSKATIYEHNHDDGMNDTDDTETKGRLEWGLL